MVQAGDRVRVQGREARVVSSWGQGKHTVWSLDDGTTVLDLEKKVAAGQAEVLRDRVTKTQPLHEEWRDLPFEDDDHEE